MNHMIAILPLNNVAHMATLSRSAPMAWWKKSLQPYRAHAGYS